MQLFVQEWSIQEKTTFPAQVQIDNKTKNEGELIAKDKKFIESARTPHLLYYPRKGIESETSADTLKLLLDRKELPSNMEELFDGWFNFRIINKEEKTCDCANFYKNGYCKHIVGLKVQTGELSDPEIKQKKKPGRKAQITKALQT